MEINYSREETKKGYFQEGQNKRNSLVRKLYFRFFAHPYYYKFTHFLDLSYIARGMAILETRTLLFSRIFFRISIRVSLRWSIHPLCEQEGVSISYDINRSIWPRRRRSKVHKVPSWSKLFESFVWRARNFTISKRTQILQIHTCTLNTRWTRYEYRRGIESCSKLFNIN